MTDPRIVVLGGTGMLGHKMFQTLRGIFPNTLCTTREDVHRPPFDQVDLLQSDDVIGGVDVTDFDRLQALLIELRPDYVVNCVGIIKQRNEAHDAVLSITINSLLPHKLAAMAQAWSGHVIHFSTDCVFSGERGYYTEDDNSDARDLYGRSKFLGEVACANALTLRTSIIGRELTEHRSLLDWFLAQNHKTVRGYRQVIYSGVTTNEMARVVSRVIDGRRELSGIYQVASQSIAKYDLLCLLAAAYGLDIEIIPDDTERSDRSMLGNRFFDVMGYYAPSWPDLIADLAADATPYAAWGISF